MPPNYLLGVGGIIYSPYS